MIHGIHSVSPPPPPPDISAHNRFDPVSLKKITQGEGTWAFEKEILGWELNGKSFTLHLPKKKCKTIQMQIRKILKQKRVSFNKFQKIAGKLQHASSFQPYPNGNAW
jgi:hypothetical protein